jgi:hypothetical protein
VAAHPPFLRYGSFGVTKVEAGREAVLVDEPVAWAWSDGAGGLVFHYHWLSGVPGIWRLPAGAHEPLEAVPEYSGVGAVVNLDGRAAVVRYDNRDEQQCEEGSIGVYDLETGQRGDLVVCPGDGDVGWFPNSHGGGLFVGVQWLGSGSCGTDSAILFWDRSGEEVDVPTNPYPFRGWGEADWIPCELDARISPDGRLLAYRFRPDSKWPCPDYDDVPYEDWLEESRKIPGEVVVLDIETGSIVYKASSEAEERLTDFDGRYLVLTTTDPRDDVLLDHDWSTVSTIVDITGASLDLHVEGQVRLIWTKV